MKRRNLILGMTGLAAASALLLRPQDKGGPYPPYFSALNQELRRNGPGRPLLLIDKDRLLANCHKVKAQLPASKAFRIVAKSLPSLPLLQTVMDVMDSKRLMVFHQPHLNAIAEAMPASDLLLGKPMPVNAAAQFYRALKNTAFNPALQLQWLIDTPERLREYQQLATSLGTRLRISIELDVGLHRGGVASPEALKPLLDIMAGDKEHLELAGFMGYDAHVGKIPSIIETRAHSFEKACAHYRNCQQALYAWQPEMAQKALVFNGGGSPTLRLHKADSPVNEVASGSCLVKPTDFDLDLLADLEPAAFIATPVLKVLEGTTIPGIEGTRRLFSLLNPNAERSYFIYGGLWQAHYESPPGLFDNSLYGKSSNQAIVNSSHNVPLHVNDQIFMRPTQSERVLLEFGDLAVISNGRLAGWWPVLPT
ncbi:MAG: alanine racemase [bacterium]|nr:alanine racemase [bacterium]